MMNNLLINLPIRVKDSGSTGNINITIRAKNNASYYQPYPYLNFNIIKKRRNFANQGYEIETANELIARTRRTVLFTDTSSLKPVNKNQNGYRILLNKVQALTHCDHSSYWISSSGTKFLMIEPYEDLNSNGTIKKLESMGLSVIEVPIQLSPYCGRWDPNPGAQPWTKCYLICDSENSHELDMIEVELLLAKVPAWNRI